MENFLLPSGFAFPRSLFAVLLLFFAFLRFSFAHIPLFRRSPAPPEPFQRQIKPFRIIRNGNCWFTSQPLKLHLRLGHVARDIGGGDHHLVALQVRVPLLCCEDPIVSIGVQLGIPFFDPPDLPPLLRMTIGLLDSSVNFPE
jgi:hypothetical protein